MKQTKVLSRRAVVVSLDCNEHRETLSFFRWLRSLRVEADRTSLVFHQEHVRVFVSVWYISSFVVVPSSLVRNRIRYSVCTRVSFPLQEFMAFNANRINQVGEVDEDENEEIEENANCWKIPERWTTMGYIETVIWPSLRNTIILLYTYICYICVCVCVYIYIYRGDEMLLWLPSCGMRLGVRSHTKTSFLSLSFPRLFERRQP